MPTTEVIPAAQYLRMSTEHQQYSMENQAAAIQLYAASHGYKIIRTYSDAGRSGLMLKRRAGLSELLGDVVAGGQPYMAILVYDVSRWGRFQDTDEAAHYEFLCKSAGVPVEYCAETFANDNTMPSLIMKSLKRAMAGEFSRELGVKVYAGQKRIAQLGFRAGGIAGFGLRRMAVSSDGTRRQALAQGELKGIKTDKTTLVPGPPDEVACVREIYRLLIEENLQSQAIARELNRRGLSYFGRPWTYETVLTVLRNLKYVGCLAYGQRTQTLGGPQRRLPRERWILNPGAFEPLVDQQTFDAAQRALDSRTFLKSNDDLIDGLRQLLAKEGQLTSDLIDKSRLVPTAATYRRRFGTLKNAYDIIGWQPRQRCAFGQLLMRGRTQRLRSQIIYKLQALFPGLMVLRKGSIGRARLRFPDGMIVSLYVCRATPTMRGLLRWIFSPVVAENEFPALVCRCNRTNDNLQDYHVLPSVDRKKRFRLREQDDWLRRGQRLDSLEDLQAVCSAYVKRTKNVMAASGSGMVKPKSGAMYARNRRR